MAARAKTTAKSKIMIAGFSGVGKTTLLAALWHVLTSTDEIAGAIKLACLPKEAEYLNALRDKWQSCEPVPHTIVASEQNLILELASAEGESLGAVVLPDLAGETFGLPWSDRQMPKSMADLFRDSSGVLLLVHATELRQSVRIRDRTELAAMLEDGATTPAPAEAPSMRTEWHPDASGTDVQLVDLVQCIQSVSGLRSEPLRLAIGVSAWDLINDTSPSGWLQQQLPLLQQYLESNRDLIQLRVYGISAQGGDYEKSADGLLEKLNPSERIKMVGDGCVPHDVTAPIAWLLGC